MAYALTNTERADGKLVIAEASQVDSRLEVKF